MRIFFWAADEMGCGYYRCQIPAAALADRGHQTMVATTMPTEWMDAGVIVGQRVCKPGPSQRWQQLAREGHSRLVFEIDDDLFTIDPSNGPAWTFFQPDILDNLRRNIQVANLVTVTSEPLADTIRPINPHVAVLPNCVPSWLLEMPAPATDRVTIGWGGGASHVLDWAEAASEVGRFVTRNLDVEAHIMGWCPPGLWRRLPADRRRFTDWIPTVPDLYRAVDFSIGLAPLRPSVFNRSKSDVRQVEAAALGIPLVASGFGPYGQDRSFHGTRGFLVTQPHQWGRCLRDLLNDPAMRAEFGANARSWAKTRTIDDNIELWEKALGRC